MKWIFRFVIAIMMNESNTETWFATKTAGPFSGTFSAPSNRSTKHVWRRIVMMSLKISYGKQNSRTAHTSRTAARQPRTISSVFKGGDLRMVAMV